MTAEAELKGTLGLMLPHSILLDIVREPGDIFHQSLICPKAAA
jgi:hypothetical protein